MTPDAEVAEKDASKGGGVAQIEIVQYILRVAFAGVGHVTTTASDLSEYCINLAFRFAACEGRGCDAQGTAVVEHFAPCSVP